MSEQEWVAEMYATSLQQRVDIVASAASQHENELVSVLAVIADELGAMNEVLRSVLTLLEIKLP